VLSLQILMCAHMHRRHSSSNVPSFKVLPFSRFVLCESAIFLARKNKVDSVEQDVGVNPSLVSSTLFMFYCSVG